MPVLLPALAIVAALGGGLVLGNVVLRQGPLEALVLCGVVPAAWLALRSWWWSVVGVLAIVALLPFATLPVGGAVTPALLEVAQLVALGVGVLVLLFDRRQRLVLSWTPALVLALMGVCVAAFALGLGRGYTTQTLHDFFKFLLSISMFFVVVQLARTLVDARLLTILLCGGATAAAGLALAMYAAGPGFTLRVLSKLIPYGYPGGRIVRHIEDDPARAMRAVGTSVDPNSFGGLLMVGVVLAGSQLLVRQRSVPLWLAAGSFTLLAPALLLTYSRGAWLGALCGLGLVCLLRRPWLLAPAAAGGVVLIAVGVGASFVQRLWLGFTLQDPATKLRMDEYRNAWAIIQEHLWFGVGFGDAPSIELQAGVSSIYLTIAERAGALGVLVFVLAVVPLTLRALWATRREVDEASDLRLSLVAAFAACLAVGVVDHYFFNPQFAHMAALFWMLAALVFVLDRPLLLRRASFGPDAHRGATPSRIVLAVNRRVPDGAGADVHTPRGMEGLLQ